MKLQLLETVTKSCGDIVHMHVAEKDILHKMVKIVKKKVTFPGFIMGLCFICHDEDSFILMMFFILQPDLQVKEKILVLIDTWQEAFGGPRAAYPQYYAAYQDLLVIVKFINFCLSSVITVYVLL